MPDTTRRAALAALAGLTCALALPLAFAATADTTAPAATSPARAVVEELAQALGTDFVYPDVGQRYAAMLREASAAGKYDTLSGTALAERLTADLQAVHADGHVGVRAVAPTPAGAAAGGSTSAPASPPAPSVPNLEAARWLAPGIAFVRFNLMASEPEDAAAAGRFMAEHVGAKVVIFDLRTNNGGGLAEMDAIFPYLYARPTPLVRMATRRSVFEREGAGPMGDLPSLRAVDGDPAFVVREHWATPNAETRLRGARVYVLTSGRTASAAEHFCLAMKASKRATLVGETTAGANHFGYGLELPGGLASFVPVGRTYDPATGQDWEGTGVQPDVPTPAKDALIRVLEREGLATDAATRLSDEVAPTKSMERRRRPT